LLRCEGDDLRAQEIVGRPEQVAHEICDDRRQKGEALTCRKRERRAYIGDTVRASAIRGVSFSMPLSTPFPTKSLYLFGSDHWW